MKKISYFLLCIGALGMFGSILLKLLQIDMPSLHIISQAIVLLGFILLPFALGNRLRKATLVQRIFLFAVFAGIILMYAGLLFRKSYWDDSRYLAITGIGLLFLVLLYIVIYRVADLLRIGPKGKPTPVEALGAMGLMAADLEKYVGVYTNEKIPLTITITEDKDTLIAQATDQSAFYLEVVGKNEFKYPKRDIVIEFNLEKNELILKQHGGYFLFEKEV